ncbi:N-acetylmuramic acid 6-phosphate etherase [Ligilactobacillus sp. Marseille-Q7487]|uniref:N-acetylmuramic acid 6-phosphate etherase n=1 Tax=Ligilactobacillus sp. Marseille-Q7487 TaxID=3022128 RepID=UPI0024A8F7F5|nr:N-acetylmuramic acid 6-phosphate etherase [Ligilactobacillus sp. Marseille-Q7487]
MQIEELTTEKRNADTLNIDTMTTLEIVETINREDQKVAQAVSTQSHQIARAIDLASERFLQGGRLIYCGAGTSGRLGVLDAVELNPTYGVSPTRAFGIMAGGDKAMYQAIEGAEDCFEQAGYDLKKVNLGTKDIVICLAASGRTPYALGALAYAKEKQALGIGIACVADSQMREFADVMIEAVTGPEVITGSTRMKAGSAQKMILNMLSTGIMIKTGKVYQNLMVDVQVTNEKLQQRALNIIKQATNCSPKQAADFLSESNQGVASAIVMAKRGCSLDEAKRLLAKNNGQISLVLKQEEK